ncbi:MAG TPA: chromosome segregation protein SMC [Firmicutes bacterium]|nr:chromosome segregation protein SMC [Bacillota bacterium]
MYLKRVELFGFKSFYKKTELEFGPGIAVVVGPNGCGKSNIVDAIRWALGEQSSKSLRGGRMDEIIFSGTQQLKPLNLAEVSLTFSGVGSRLNLDYEEVTVTRRLYRSGESEYLLNKTPCRLKDITELFLDTGMGKDFYSVIGQGRIEEIINSRPEERREIFEEAAGILKYKLRKKEAQRRLEETRENMTRVQDLIYELETQVEPLREQAEVAKKYRSVEEQVNSGKRELLAYRISLFQEQSAKIESKLHRSGAAVTTAVAEAGRREERLFELKRQIQEKARALEVAEQELSEQVREAEQMEGKHELLLERKSRYQEQLQENGRLHQRYLDEWNRLTGLSQQLGQELERKRLAISKEQERCRNLEQNLKQFEEGNLLKAVEQQQQALLEVSSQYNAVEAAERELVLQQERLEKRGESLQQEDQEIKHKLTELISRQEEFEPKLNSCRQQVAGLEASRQKILHKIQEADGRLETIRKKQQEEREELRALDSRLQLLREQEIDLSGYYRGVKAVLQASQDGKSVLTGILGPVVDLISVEEKYLRAVEVALGSGLQYIVTATEKAAREAIGYLKKGSLGWATFLPLDTIRVYPSGLDRYLQWRDQDGALGKLAEFVQVKPEYRRVVDYLLGNVAVCRDLETASQVARAIKYSCQVISLQGEVINPGGSMRGGSLPRRSTGLLGRRHEIGILQEERAGVEQQQVQSSRQANRLQTKLISKRADLEEANRRLDEQQRQLARLVKIKESLVHDRRYLESRCKNIESDRKDYLEEQAALAARLGAAGQQARELKHKLNGVQKALEGKKGLYEQSLARKDQLEKELTGYLISLSSLQEQRRTLEEKLGRAVEEAKQKNLEIEHQQGLKEKNTRSLEDNQNQQAELRRQLQQRRKLLVSAGEQVEHQREEMHRLRSELAGLESEDQSWRERRQRLERRKQKLDLEQTRLQAELKLWRMRYSELFGDEEPPAPGPEFDPEQVESKLKQLHEQLESLGEVNLGAIEELSRLEERIGFLNRQLEDLRQGEQSLYKVLAEIDQHMSHYFTQTLSLINDNFLTVFKDLFGGGKAYLELTDPDHLLESGVEIIAQPPGKKLQSITLLSTGEKVLTALALIFSILLHKPAPFYLLDEVESALDEANLVKFTSYLQKLSGQAQFILITHRKRTMETADIIYGVTMPEPGITKLVSVKIDEKAS